MSDSPKQLDLAAVRARLDGARGRDYWRSLDDLAATPEFQDLLEREFPRQAVGWSEDEDANEGRRNFLKLMGASLALAGMTACTRQPTEHIMPYVRQPEELIPGKPLFFATATTLHGMARGVLAESHEGRPTKLEGNPEHPATLGACDPYSQASVLQLYDPDRSQALSLNGEIRSWQSFTGAMRDALAQQKGKNGAGIRILTETITSPTIASQLAAIQKLFPASKWHQWEPTGPHGARVASVLTFGQPQNTYYDFSVANVVVSLDADFLSSGAASLRYARQFAKRRRVNEPSDTMNRLYVVEPMPTPTGTKADHRLPMRASDVEDFARSLGAALGIGEAPKGGDKEHSKWIAAIAKDLLANKGASIVIAGEQQPPAVHLIAALINDKLGNAGKTVFHTDPVEAHPVDQLASLKDLVADLNAGAVEILVILGGNPAFTAPVEMGMRDTLKKAKMRVRLGMYADETSEVCNWQVPEAHFLEAWGDARAFDGTVTIQQPLIQPLYGGRSAVQLLQAMIEQVDRTSYEIVKGYWASQHTGTDFEAWWRRSVHDGLVAGTALPVKTPAVHAEGLVAGAAKAADNKLEVVFRPDPTIHDGRHANNGWLQELPKPITKLTWDNAAILSPATAGKLGVQTGDQLKLTYQGRTLTAPVFIQPGHVKDSVTMHLGYGRTAAGRAGNGMGFNPYGLRTGSALWQDTGLEAVKTDGTHEFASTQNFHMLEAPDRRHIIHKATIAEFKKNPEAPHEGAENPPKELTLYPDWKYEGYAWGHGDRPELLHGVRRLRGGLPGGEQYRGGG